MALQAFGLSAVNDQAVDKTKAIDAAVGNLLQQLTGITLAKGGSKGLGEARSGSCSSA